MPSERLTSYLEANHVRFETLHHASAVTAQEAAAAAHVRGKEFAKTVMVNLDNELAMMVLPAHMKVNTHQLQAATGAHDVRIASEDEFRDAFPGCELGAMPPFGNLYEMPVFVADVLAEDEKITFNAGSHTEAIRIAYHDFERLVKPVPVQLRTEH